MVNEKRLIDANALDALENLDYVYDPVRDGCEWYRAADVWDCIEREPTVDATEVVHGRWVKNGWNDYSCSVCKCQLIGHGASGWNYCPHCGAKMDGEQDEK